MSNDSEQQQYEKQTAQQMCLRSAAMIVIHSDEEKRMMDSKGILIVVSGFSGAGKGTLMKELLKQYPGQYTLSISATTRQPRDGEEDGREYFFITTEEFEKMIAQDQLIEYARYVNNYYGTPRAYVEQKLEEGKDVILEIEIQGHRLTCRGTETEEVIDSRLRRAVEEADGMDQYDYLIINDDLERCAKELHDIVQGEHRKSFRNTEFMEKIKQDLQRLKGE